MAVYDIDGANTSTVYEVDGSTLTQAYDIDGEELLSNSNLVVMSYNVQWFSALNGNEEMQQGIIGEYNADIIGLQELTKTGTIPSVGTTVLSDYPYKYIGTQSNRTGLASKRALSNVSSSLFSTQASEQRGYQKAYLTVGDKTICWVNTHLETSSYENVKVAQAAELFDLVENEEYFIITGDFNTVCKSVNDTEYTTIMKQFIDAGYNSANCSQQHGFLDTWTDGNTASGTWYPCDHIITSANISIDEVIVDETKIGVAAQTGQTIDHLPIIAYLTIS